MKWRDAIEKSPKGTATRVRFDKENKLTDVRYRDGSIFTMVSRNGKVVDSYDNLNDDDESNWNPS